MPVLTGSETYCALLTGSPIPAPIILTCHDQVDADVFSEFTVGLDHVCLAVDNLEVLAAWQRHLNQHEVPYSFRRSEWGHHVNLRDPDTAPAGAGGAPPGGVPGRRWSPPADGGRRPSGRAGGWRGRRSSAGRPPRGRRKQASSSTWPSVSSSTRPSSSHLWTSSQEDAFCVMHKYSPAG